MFWLLILSFLFHTAHAHPFNQEAEFPNYFAIPGLETFESRKLLEKTITNHLRRLTVSLVVPGTGHAQQIRYFDFMEKELRQIDPAVRILPSGGVVRAELSAIYAEIKRDIENGVSTSAKQTLERIATETNDVPGIQVRGLGGDFDLLLEPSDPKLFKALANKALELTNSAEEHYHFRDVQGGIKRSLFLVGDVKEYSAQIRRSTSQGGSTLDFLAFDLEKKAFVEPEGFKTIVNDFLQGYYSYVGPQNSNDIEDLAKQAIRGLRPFLELPFLKLKSDRILREELEQVADQVRTGQKISPEARKQFDKMVRNHRYEGAHNRFYRGIPGSIEQQSLALASLIGENEPQPLIPEFGDFFLISQRSRLHSYTELPDGIPLMPIQEFIEKHTDNGTLYHGTPNAENALAILRGGFFISSNKQGTSNKQGIASFGRGVYSSPQFSVASQFAGQMGIIFNLKLQHQNDLRILDWDEVKDLPAIQKIAAVASAKNEDLFAVLGRHYGIDIIVNQHVLIQNLDAVQTPNNLSTLILAYQNLIKNTALPLSHRLRWNDAYKDLYAYGMALGQTDLSIPTSNEKIILDILDEALTLPTKERSLKVQMVIKFFELNSEETMLEDLRANPELFLWIQHTLKNYDPEIAFKVALVGIAAQIPNLGLHTAIKQFENKLSSNQAQQDLTEVLSKAWMIDLSGMDLSESTQKLLRKSILQWYVRSQSKRGFPKPPQLIIDGEEITFASQQARLSAKIIPKLLELFDVKANALELIALYNLLEQMRSFGWDFRSNTQTQPIFEISKKLLQNSSTVLNMIGLDMVESFSLLHLKYDEVLLFKPFVRKFSLATDGRKGILIRSLIELDRRAYFLSSRDGQLIVAYLAKQLPKFGPQSNFSFRLLLEYIQQNLPKTHQSLCTAILNP